MTRAAEDSANNMKKLLIFVLVVIILLVGGFFAYKYYGSSQLKPVAQQKQNSQTLKENAISLKQYSKADNYTISISYPEFSGINNTAVQNKINSDIKNYILNLFDQDKKSAKENCNFSNLPGGAPDWQCEYDLGSDSFDTAGGKILSIKFEYYQFTGGAHGGTEVEFLNYNLATGEKINWQNVFKKDSNYLQLVADYSKADLTKNLLQSKDGQLSDSDWIQTGTDPKTKENYTTNIGFTNGGLDVVFGQYQVAPYSTGMPEVVIPYSQLKNVLDPNGLLGNYTR